MKISILILFSFLFYSCATITMPKVEQKDNSKTEDVSFSPMRINEDEIFIPQNLEEAHLELDRGLSEHAKEILRKDRNELTEEEQNSYDHSLGHFGLGLWMRNNWNLWKGGKLSQFFNELGIYHPDDMTGIIFKSYIAKLRGEKYSIEEDIEYYKSYMKSMETPKEGSPNDGAEIAWVITKGQGKGTIHLGISKSDNSFWRYEYGPEKGIEPAKPEETEDIKRLMEIWKELDTTPEYIKNMSYATHNQKNTEVSFYLVNNKISDDDVRKNNLSGVVLDKSPVFTTKDIIEYSQSEHTIKLTPKAYKVFCTIPDYAYFAVCVDNRPVYLGQIGSKKWGAQVVGLTIETNDECNEIQLIYGIDLNPDGLSSIVKVGDIPESMKGRIDDLRQNKWVLESLKKSNKLVETISELKALEIAKKFFLKFNYGPIEQYKFTVKSGCKSWSIFYTGHGKYNWRTNHGAIIVDKKTGETKHMPGMKL